MERIASNTIEVGGDVACERIIILCLREETPFLRF
jgi:hypothetical protein